MEQTETSGIETFSFHIQGTNVVKMHYVQPYMDKASTDLQSIVDSLQVSEAHFFDEDRYNEADIKKVLDLGDQDSEKKIVAMKQVKEAILQHFTALQCRFDPGVTYLLFAFMLSSHVLTLRCQISHSPLHYPPGSCSCFLRSRLRRPVSARGKECGYAITGAEEANVHLPGAVRGLQTRASTLIHQQFSEGPDRPKPTHTGVSSAGLVVGRNSSD